MATKKEIQARVALGPSVAPMMGIEALRTIAYMLARNPEDGSIVPISGEVMEWKAVKALPWSKRCIGVVENVVIIERVIYDHVKKRQFSDFHLRDFS